MFKIIIIGGYAEAYIERCLKSLCDQKETCWEAQIVLDPTGDNTYKNSLKFSSDKIHIKLNKQRQFALHNIKDAINLSNPSDEDIIVCLDADDWFYDDNVLPVLKSAYTSKTDLLLTYGSWIGYPDSSCKTNNAPYTEEHFKKGIRKVKWRGGHLKTFKYKLWKHVKDEDLKNIFGEYLKITWDLAMMWPMMEMAGSNRIMFIARPMYVYNTETFFSDDKIHLREQMFTTNLLASKKPYSYVENL